MDKADIVKAVADRERDEGTSVEVESRYECYGNRGEVDVRVDRGDRVTLFRIEPDSAIEEATGANEILEQFNRMKRYYFHDDSNETPTTGMVRYVLGFVPTRKAVEHLRENFQIYQSSKSFEKESRPDGYFVERSEVWLVGPRRSVRVTESVIHDRLLLNNLDSDTPIRDYDGEYG